MSVRLSAEEAFHRAELMRGDWEAKKFKSYTDLAKHYGVCINYARNVVLGKKCVRLEIPGKENKDWKYCVIEGVKFAVFRDGRIWGCSHNSFKEVSPDEGYLHFHVVKAQGRGRRKVYVHRLVLMVWKRLPEPGEVARHLNDDTSDNSASNLEWGFPQDNLDDKVANGGVLIGEHVNTAKLTEKQVLKFANGYTGQPRTEYVRQFIRKNKLDIAEQTLLAILQGRYWSHLTGIKHESVSAGRNIVPENIAVAIHRNFNKVKQPKKAFCMRFSDFLKSKGHNIGWKTIKQVLDGKLWSHLWVKV